MYHIILIFYFIHPTMHTIQLILVICFLQFTVVFSQVACSESVQNVTFEAMLEVGLKRAECTQARASSTEFDSDSKSSKIKKDAYCDPASCIAYIDLSRKIEFPTCAITGINVQESKRTVATDIKTYEAACSSSANSKLLNFWVAMFTAILPLL